MKQYLLLATLIFLSAKTFGQNYERNSICGSDTINVDVRRMKTVDGLSYKAFECTRVSKLGIRVELGFNHYVYNSKTKDWLGNHNGALFGLAIASGDFNIGVKFKPATVNPQQDLYFGGELLTKEAKLNPIKVDYDVSYSFNFKHNITLEPYVALTLNDFRVINEKELGKTYSINRIKGLTVGTTVNKYFHLKEFQFLVVFARYGYGLSNFKKANDHLGVGYSDIVFGIGYKGFSKLRFLKRL